MSNKKIHIDSLPCSNGSYSGWFWAMIVCAVISFLTAIISAIRFSNLHIFWLYPIIAIPGLIFNLIFARSLKSVSSGLSLIWIILASLSFINSVWTMIAGDDFGDKMSSMIPLWIIIIISFIFYIIFIANICVNYKGRLGEFGRNLWLVPLIVIGVAFICGILIAESVSVEFLPQIFTFLAAAYILYLVYDKILRLMYVMLRDGYDDNLTDQEMRQYILLERSGSSTQTSMNGYSGNSLELTNDESNNRNLIYIIIGSIVLGAVLVVGGYLVYQKYSTPKDVDEWDEGIYEHEDEEEKEVYESEEEEYQDEWDSWMGEADPDWMPSDFREVMFEEGLSTLSPQNVRDVRRILNGETYIGRINDNKIRLAINEIDADGSLRGRYAYQSTLDKYGNEKNSWFEFEGSFMGNAYLGGEDTYYLAFKSINPQTGKVFEYWLLESDGSDRWSGRMVNVIHKDNPSDNFYDVAIRSTN